MKTSQYNEQRKKSDPRNKKKFKNGTIYVILILFSVVNAYPILWMVMNSFKSSQEFLANPLSIPHKIVFDNYISAWITANLGVLFFNSAFVVGVSVLLTVFLGALASYFLARFKFKMNKLIHTLFVFGMLIPIHAMLVPMFILITKLGLLDTHFTLVFPYIALNLPITVFILTSFMKAFPKDIEESAIMDGCGYFRIFWSIILPMTKPAIATVVILNFINVWNEFSYALVLINDPNLQTIPLGLANFAGKHSVDYGAQMAGLTMVLIPTLIFYLIMERDIVKGMTAGAVKG